MISRVSSLCTPALRLRNQSRTWLCSPSAPGYSSSLMLAQTLPGRVVKQIGNLITLRSSLGFWHHRDVIICERTTLPTEPVGGRDPAQPYRWKADRLSLIQEQPISCFHASHSVTCSLGCGQGAPARPTALLNSAKYSPGSSQITKSVKAAHKEA